MSEFTSACTDIDLWRMSRVMIWTFVVFGWVLLECYKTMMGVNHCLIKEQSVCRKTPQSVWRTPPYCREFDYTSSGVHKYTPLLTVLLAEIQVHVLQMK